MAQDLYYISGSQSLTLVNENGTTYWDNISRLEISGSAYDATISGSEFGGTVGTARIYAYSGSILMVSFPLEGTNLNYNNVIVPFSNSFISIDLSSITNDSTVTGSYFSIYNLSTTSSYLIISDQTGSSGFSLDSGNTYLFTISGSTGYDVYLYLNDITTGSNVFTISASNSSTSASYAPIAFHDYFVTFSVIVPAP